MRISDWSSDVSLPIFGKIGAIPRDQRGAGKRAAMMDRGPGQHPRAQRFDHVGPVSREQVAHHAGAQDEAVIGAAAHPAGADLGEDMAAVDRYLVLGAGHDLEQMVRRVPEDIVALLAQRSEEHTSELQSLMRNSYAVFCLKKKNKETNRKTPILHTANYSTK